MTPDKAVIAEALRRIGVEIAGKVDDPHRWSRTDLAKDLAAELAVIAERSER